MHKVCNSVLLFVVMWIVLTGCDEVIVDNISDDRVALLAPKDSLVSSPGELTFWWKELDHADKYQLVVVTPSMTNPDVLILDTLITGTQFTHELEAGKYQWCVRGVNLEYETEYFCRVIEIED